jgi:hypothetical protein
MISYPEGEKNDTTNVAVVCTSLIFINTGRTCSNSPRLAQCTQILFPFPFVCNFSFSFLKTFRLPSIHSFAFGFQNEIK